MNRKIFKQEIIDYKQRGGDFAFTFGDIRLPVEYSETLGVLSVQMPNSISFLIGS